MRKECPDCIIYRSFPSFKGDCDPCVLDLTEEDCTPPTHHSSEPMQSSDETGDKDE